MIDHYDRLGRPISADRWIELMRDPAYRRVTSTELPEVGIWVSTVWLGLNHDFLGGPPIIFETMSFTGNPDLDEQDRYRTEAEALEGHVRVVRSYLAPDTILALGEFEVPVDDPEPRRGER